MNSTETAKCQWGSCTRTAVFQVTATYTEIPGIRTAEINEKCVCSQHRVGMRSEHWAALVSSVRLDGQPINYRPGRHGRDN